MKGGERRRKYMTMTMRTSGKEDDLLGGPKAERDLKVERSRQVKPGPKVKPDPKAGLGPRVERGQKVELEVSRQQLKCVKGVVLNHLAENQLRKEANPDRKVLDRKVVAPRVVVDLQGVKIILEQEV